MRNLKITGCSDRLMWYSGLVGELVPFLREEHDCYLSREPAGYVNIVKKCDAEVVGVESAPVGIFNDGQMYKGTKVQTHKGIKEKW